MSRTVGDFFQLGVTAPWPLVIPSHLFSFRPSQCLEKMYGAVGEKRSPVCDLCVVVLSDIE